MIPFLSKNLRKSCYKCLYLLTWSNYYFEVHGRFQIRRICRSRNIWTESSNWNFNLSENSGSAARNTTTCTQFDKYFSDSLAALKVLNFSHYSPKMVWICPGIPSGHQVTDFSLIWIPGILVNISFIGPVSVFVIAAQQKKGSLPG